MVENMHEEQQSKNKGPAIVLIGVILAVIGMGLSLYLTLHHLDVKAQGFTDAACNINETFSCDDIARSEYAEVFGIPLGVYGLGYFISLAFLLLVGFFREEYKEDCLQVYTPLVGIGVLSSIGLGLIAHFLVGALCVGCIGIYLTTFANAYLVYAFRSEFPFKWNKKSLSNGSIYPIVALGTVVCIYQVIKPTSRDFKRDVPQTFEQLNANKRQLSPILSPIKEEFTINRSAYSGYGEDYRTGSDDAKVVITEFSDFECPACSGAYRTLKRIKKDYGDSVQIVYKNFPLDTKCNQNISRRFHDFACDAAIMARCLGGKGLFWDYHNKIYDNQDNLNLANLKSWAKELGLNSGEINGCLASSGIMDKIKDDISIGQKINITGTPTLFINNHRVLRPDYDSLRQEIDRLLQ